MKKVGLLCGREWSWPPKFLEAVNGRNAGVTAEFIKLGGTRMDEPNPYAVVVDRISHEVPYYRSYMKKAVLDGTTVNGAGEITFDEPAPFPTIAKASAVTLYQDQFHAMLAETDSSISVTVVLEKPAASTVSV